MLRGSVVRSKFDKAEEDNITPGSSMCMNNQFIAASGSELPVASNAF